MQTIKILLPYVPPSNNLNQGHSGKSQMFAYQKAKKQIESDIGWLAKKPPKPLMQCVVLIDYYFKNNIRRDADNYSGKMILDGLKNNNIIADDNYNCVFCVPFFYKDKVNVRTEITVIEVDDLNNIRQEIKEKLCSLNFHKQGKTESF